MNDEGAKTKQVPIPAVDEVVLHLELYRHDQLGWPIIGHIHLVTDESHAGNGIPINRIGRLARERAHAQLDEFFDEVNLRWNYLMGDKAETAEAVPDRELLMLGYTKSGIPMPIGSTIRWETIELMIGETSDEQLTIAADAIRANVRVQRAQRTQHGLPIDPAVLPEPQP